MGGLSGQRVLLGVSGGIAAYKSADLARRLMDAGADVQVVMTESAQQFVTALTFQALTGKPVRTSLWDVAAEAAMGHIELARWATRILVAPASADFMARLAHGMANDLLSTVCLASAAPVTLAPAMNRVMWANAATQANLSILLQRGVQVLGPGEGEQACGEVGAGRMLEPLQIIAGLCLEMAAVAVEGERAAGGNNRLAGRKLLISAGPTYEDIDPVRYLGNRSSGKMGFALAGEAAAMGADVLLVSGPSHLPTPEGVSRVTVRRAVEMRDAVLAGLPGMDAYIGAAAVADFMPARTHQQKLKKSQGAPVIELVPTPDILAEVAMHASRPALVVGFAAETADLEANALAKLRAKKVDMIAANDVGIGNIGFDADDNALTVFDGHGRHEIARGSKASVARQLLRLVAGRLDTTA